MTKQVIVDIVFGVLIVTTLSIIALLHINTMRLREELDTFYTKCNDKEIHIEEEIFTLKSIIKENTENIKKTEDSLEFSKKAWINSLSQYVNTADFSSKLSEVDSKILEIKSKTKDIEAEMELDGTKKENDIKELKNKIDELRGKIQEVKESVNNNDLEMAIEKLKVEISDLKERYNELLMDCSFTVPAIETEVIEDVTEDRLERIFVPTTKSKQDPRCIKIYPEDRSKSCPYWFYVN